MAATVSAWGKPGAWALDSEENEAELFQHQQPPIAAVQSNGGDPSDFPSLSAAATTKTKKKKAQTLSLHEFSTYSAAKAASNQVKGLTTDELLALPTGPRERSAEELDRSKLGGGFRSYGGGTRDEQPRRQGSFNRDSDREFVSSRADEADNWGAGKKASVGGGFERRERGERGERGGFFSDSQSRADEVDNWGSKKSFVPSETRRVERRGSFGFDSNSSGAESGNWSKRTGGGAFDSLENRRGGGSGGAEGESWGRRREEVSVGGGGGGRPKLNLQPRTLPVVVEEQKSVIDIVVKPEVEEERSVIDIVVKPRTSNPFGEARPREEVLKEKGQDWKKIEEKLESTKIKEVAPADGAVAAKKSFWSGNGRDRLQREDKAERAWRKPDAVEPRPESAGESENGHPENTETGHAEEDEEKDSQI